MFGIFSLKSGSILGATGLHEPDWALRSFEIGYWLRASVVGHGYAGEAVKGLCRMAFKDLDARRIEIRCDPRNDRSRRVAESLGCIYEGRLRKVTLDPLGHPRDSLVFSLIDDDNWHNG